MAVAVAIFGVTFAAFCLWLGVRIFNRRERWAKWTAAGIAIVVAYPLSCPIVFWVAGFPWFPLPVYQAALLFYRPIFSAAREAPEEIVAPYAYYHKLILPNDPLGL